MDSVATTSLPIEAAVPSSAANKLELCEVLGFAAPGTPEYLFHSASTEAGGTSSDDPPPNHDFTAFMSMLL